MKFDLKDGAPRRSETVAINVSKKGNTLEIGADGVEPAPILVEFYSGNLTIRVFHGDGSPALVLNTLTATPTKEVSVAEIAKDAPALTAAITTKPVTLDTATQDESFDEAAFDAA